MHWETKTIVTSFIAIFTYFVEPNLQYIHGIPVSRTCPLISLRYVVVPLHIFIKKKKISTKKALNYSSTTLTCPLYSHELSELNEINTASSYGM